MASCSRLWDYANNADFCSQLLIFFFFLKKLFFFHENKRQFSQVECCGLSLLRSASARVWQCCLGSSGAGAIPNGFTKLSLEEGDRHWPAHCNQCENPCSWLFITAPNWKQPKCPSAVEWRNQWWCIHTMEYPPAQREPAASQLSIHGWASQTCRVWKKAGTQENTPQDPIYKKHKCRWNSSVVLEVGCWFSWGGRMRTSSCFFHLMLIKQVHWVCEDSLSWTPRAWAFFSLALSRRVLMPLFLSSTYLLNLYFTLQLSWLTMLWWFQVDSEGTQPYIYMYLFSPQLPSHPGCHLTLSRVPCAYSRSLLVIHCEHSNVYMSTHAP